MPTAPLAYEAFLEVYNSGKEARQVEITVSGAGQQRIVKNVRIEGGQSLQGSARSFEVRWRRHSCRDPFRR